MIFSDNLFFGLFPFVALLYYWVPGFHAQAGFLVFVSVAFMAMFGLGGVVFALAIILVVWLGSFVQEKLGLRGRWPLVLVLATALVASKLAPSFIPKATNPIGASYYIFILLGILWFLPRRVTLMTAVRTVFFLPHILAGPISRPKSFLPQFDRRKRLQLRNVFIGTQLLLLGYAKKTLIADPIGLSTAPVWHDPSAYSAAAIALSIFAFYIQLYADFSGYTDMARGIARILGYRLPINFRGPYLAATPIEFWSRWHVSLSTWVRLNVYTPLSMMVWRRVRSKRAVGPATFGIVVIMMAGVGLWHEMSLRFLLFGVLQGVMIGAWYIALGRDARLKGVSWWASWLLFQLLLILSLTLFRANSWTDLWSMFTAVLSFQGGNNLVEMVPGLLAAAAAVFGLQWLEFHGTRRRVAAVLVRLRRAPPAFPAAALAIVVIMFFKGLSLEGVWVAPNDPFFHAEHVQFIYARF